MLVHTIVAFGFCTVVLNSSPENLHLAVGYFLIFFVSGNSVLDHSL